MDKNQERQTSENAAIQFAACEKRFQGKSLLEEIALVLPDYFVAEKIGMEKEKIEMFFYNGQKFCLKVLEM